MDQKAKNKKVFDMFTKNEDALKKENPYAALEADAMAMYMKDPKEFRAFVETMDEGSGAYKAALEGKKTAIEVMKGQNRAYNAEIIYKEVFGIANNLRILDPAGHKEFGEKIKERGGPALAAFEAGTHKAEKDLKYGIYREGSMKQKDKEKKKDKDKGKGIDFDD